MKVHTIEEHVRYVETDRMRVVHHSTYLAWFEIGRTSLLAESGHPYHELEAEGLLFPVIEYQCRMTGRADYGDTVRIDTTIETLRSRTVVFIYEAFVRGETVATGRTQHVAVDLNHKPRRMPSALLDALQGYVTQNESQNP
ncbi:MAG: thioesterase family protein [bacterium]|nr:thioesterase family protein [bacterium]